LLASLHLQLGNVAEWAAGVGTVAAFVVTALALRRDSKVKEKEQADRQWDEANKVRMSAVQSGYQRPDHSPGTLMLVTITNDGRRSISDVEVEVFTKDQQTKLAEGTTPMIASGVFIHFKFFDIPFDQWLFTTGADVFLTVRFKDIAGQRWSKDIYGDPIQVKTS